MGLVSLAGFGAGRDSTLGRVVAGFASVRGAGLFSVTGRVVAGFASGCGAGLFSFAARVVAGFASGCGAGLFSFAARVVAVGCCVAVPGLAVATGRVSFAFTGFAPCAGTA